MFCIVVDTLLTRMHSSRMRTVLYSGHLGGGWGWGSAGEGVCQGVVCQGVFSARGCLSAWGMCTSPCRGVCQEGICQRGVCQRGVCQRGVCQGVCLGGVFLGGVWPGGVCLGGVHLPSPLWTEFLTHVCEKITFSQHRFRTVIKRNRCGKRSL